MDRRRLFVFASCASLLLACGDSKEAPHVQLAVFVDSGGVMPVDTDLGYHVTLSEARVVVDDLQFAVAGEAHLTAWTPGLEGLFVSRAYAHPGHYQGGEVTGELRGHFLLQWVPGDGAELGMAELVVGKYTSANFTFSRATEDDVDSADDALIGHTGILRGTAENDDVRIDFELVMDSPEGRQLVGIPFELDVTEASTERLGLRFDPLDPLVEGDTFFNGVDFAALDADADGNLVLDPDAPDPALVDAYNQLHRTFQTHNYFYVQPSAPGD